MPAAVLEKKEAKKVEQQKRIVRPPVALYENGESYVALIEMPGVDEKSIDVRLDKGILTIEAPLKADLPEESTLRYSEIRLGDYRRSFDLAEQVDEETIEASFSSGLLKLTMPKAKGARARKIAIKAG